MTRVRACLLSPLAALGHGRRRGQQGQARVAGVDESEGLPHVAAGEAVRHFVGGGRVGPSDPGAVHHDERPRRDGGVEEEGADDGQADGGLGWRVAGGGWEEDGDQPDGRCRGDGAFVGGLLAAATGGGTPEAGPPGRAIAAVGRWMGDMVGGLDWMSTPSPAYT